MAEYKEIIELYAYCQKIDVHAELTPMFDGFHIRFKNGGDVIQHKHSYGCDNGCVEPAIGCKRDYTAVPVKDAKRLIRRYKDRLNGCACKAVSEDDKGRI